MLRRNTQGALLALILTASALFSQGRGGRIERAVRHELIMLPFYGVFDNLSFRVEGAAVILTGQVTRPALKTDAERAVKRLEGVETVDNRIEVLPLSPNDDQVRMMEYRAIYYHPALDRYAIRAVPPIHIIVKNGDVTLVGYVASQADKNLAGLYANGVPGVFSVKNDLLVEQ
jgi:hyperosmotically inducible protein